MKNYPIPGKCWHTLKSLFAPKRITPVAALFLMTACAASKDDPKPIIDPPVPAYRLDYEVSWTADNPDVKDKTHYIYNNAGQLVRIASIDANRLNDTSYYNFAFEYDSKGTVVERRVRYPANDPYRKYVYKTSGNQILMNIYTFDGAFDYADKYYLNEVNQPVYMNDTTIAQANQYSKLTWTETDVQEFTNYRWNGTAHYAFSNSKYTYDPTRFNPYYIARINWQRGISDFGIMNYSNFSQHIIKKQEGKYFDNDLSYIRTFEWTYSPEGLPIKCTQTETSSMYPNKVLTTYFEYHFSIRQ